MSQPKQLTYNTLPVPNQAPSCKIRHFLFPNKQVVIVKQTRNFPAPLFRQPPTTNKYKTAGEKTAPPVSAP